VTELHWREVNADEWSWMTLDEVAARTGRSIELLRRWARDGRIPATLVGRSWIVEHKDLARIKAMPARGTRSAITVRPWGWPTDPTKAELEALANALAAATGERARASTTPLPRDMWGVGAAGGGDEPLVQVIDVVLSHATEAFVGGVVGVIAAWARSRFLAAKGKLYTAATIYGPDGKPIKIVRLKNRAGRPSIDDPEADK